jgi:hypothetical protein
MKRQKCFGEIFGEILGDEKAKIDEPVTWLIASDIARNLRVFALD